MFYPIRCKHDWNGEFYEDNGMPEMMYVDPDCIDMVYTTLCDHKFVYGDKDFIVHPDDVESFKQMILDNRVQGIWQESDKEGYPLAFDYREG